AHLFLDGALHAHKADAELVFHQLTHGAHTAVAEVVDVVHDADIFAQLQQVLDRCVEVFRRQSATVEWRGVLVLIQLDVELQTAYAREVVLARIEEHSFKERSRSIDRWRIAGAQLAVDLQQGLYRRAY